MKRAAISLLTVCGLEELDSHRDGGVTHVLSILDPGTADPGSFGLYDPHHRTTLRFHDIVVPVPGMVLPERSHVEQIVAFGEEVVDDLADGGGGRLLIHCHMGISRSTAAMLMMLASSYPDETSEQLADRLIAIRPQAWPNARMIGFADEILGREGSLSDAVSGLHARQIAAKPHLADVMRGLGRALEVDRAIGVAAA